MRVTTYEEAVAVYLNREYLRSLTVGDLVLALQIANNEVRFPREWVRYGEGS